MLCVSEDDFSEFEFIDIEQSEEDDQDRNSATEVSPMRSFVLSNAMRIVEYFDPEIGHPPTAADVLPNMTPPIQDISVPEKPEEDVTAPEEVVRANVTAPEGVGRAKADWPVVIEGKDIYSCKKCGTHISKEESIESKAFQVGQGPFAEAKRGYLFKTAVNLKALQPCPENFTTGRYKISYVECLKCEQQLGWKYLESEKLGGMAKIGKFCLKLSDLSLVLH